MARWVVVIILVLVGVLLATRSLNGVSRVAAATEIGRRHPYAVHGWPVWRLLLATVVVLVAFGLATSGGRPATPAPATTSAPATPSATTAATGSAGRPGTLPATPPPAAVAPVAATGGGIPGWAWLAIAAAGVLVVVVGASSRRRRSARELEYLLGDTYDGPGPSPARRDEYETTDDPWEQAGTWPTERTDQVGTTEEHDHAQAPEDTYITDDAPGGDAGDPGVDEPGREGRGTHPMEDLVGGQPGATVHNLSRRRRRSDRDGV